MQSKATSDFPFVSILLSVVVTVLLFLNELDAEKLIFSALVFLLASAQFSKSRRGYILLAGGILVSFTACIVHDVEIEILIYNCIISAINLLLFYFIFAKSLFINEASRYKGDLLNEVFNNSPDAIFLLDFYSRNIVDCNDRAVKMFGYKEKQSLIGASRDEIIINKLSDEEFTKCKKQIALKGIWEKNLQYQTIDGREFWGKVSITPLQVKKNKYYVTRIIDITETVEARGNIEHMNEQLNIVINAVNAVVYSTRFIDGKQNLDFVSDRIDSVYGISIEEYKKHFLQGTILSLVHEDDRDSVVEANRRLGNKQNVIITYRFKQPKKDEYVWIEEQVFPQFNNHGEVIGYYGLGTDVTARKQYENALKDSEERYRSLFERNLAGVYKASVSDKKILDCNDSFARIFGFEEKEEVIGKYSPDIYVASSDQGSFHEKLLSRKSMINHESKIELINGREIWILENSMVVEENGKPSYIEGTLIEITQLKETQEALRESEENLSLVINSLDDIIYNIETTEEHKNGVFKYISPQIEDIIGMTPQEYEEKSRSEGLASFVHPEDLDNVIAMIKVIIEKQKPISITYRLRNQKTLNYHWIEENIYPKVEDGKIMAKFGIMRDVTQKKFAEEALRISEKRYRGLVERNMAGVFRVSPKDKVIDCNISLVNLLGYDNIRDIKSVMVKDLYYKREDQIKLVSELKKKKAITNYEVCLKRKNGEPIWCLINANLNEDWQLIEGTLIDITELKETGEALMESEHALATLLGKLPGMAYRCKIDENWTMEYMSDGCVELTGYQPEDIIGNKTLSFNDIIHEDYRSAFDEILDEASTKRRFVFEYPIVDKSGKEKWVWEQCEVIFDEEGKPCGLEGFITDITSRKHYEQTINTRREEYQHLIDGSPYGIVIHQDGQIKYANHKAFELLGIQINAEETDELLSYEEYFKDDKMARRTIYEFLLDEYHDHAFERKDKLLGGDELPFIEVKLKTLSGNIIDVETRSSLITYKGEKAIQAVFNDITAKKELIKAQAENTLLENEIEEHMRTQKQLRENQRFTKNLLDSSLDMILASDNEGNISEINQAALDKFGYTFDEIINISPKRLYKNPETYDNVAKHLNDKGRFIGEVENVDKSGKVFSSILSASIIKNEEGKQIGSMGISRDITEIKDVERVLSEQSSTIKSIFESNSNMLIWIVDEHLNFISFNNSFFNAAKLLLGEKPEATESLLSMVEKHLTTEDYDYFMSYFNRALRGTTQQFEVKLRDIRKNDFWLELYLSPIILENGEIREIACLAHEITDKKYTEEKIKESLYEKEILLKEVHHRVKNNLQVISSILNLQSSYVEDKNTLNILRESQNRIKSMSFIHESLYQTETFSSINFSEYILNLSKNLVYTYQVNPGKLDQQYDISEISLDLDQAIPCGLIVNELVSNALKYAFPEMDGENQKKASIFIGLSEENDEITMVVSDNGIGLPPNFDYENTNTLGLQLVVTLVEQLDGKLTLIQENGTKYLITFTRQKQKTHG